MSENSQETHRGAVRNELVDDLGAEQDALLAVLSRLAAEDWERPTPAPGWTVRDQVTHLAFFDRSAARSVADPSGFATEAADAAQDHDAYHEAAIEAGRRRQPASVLAHWREHASSFRSAAAAADPTMRCHWYVTEMSLVSLISARLMETWAHGQDVRDTVGVPPVVSDRLRHVAVLGCNAMPYAFHVNGRPPPASPVRVELALPSGGTFTAGPEDAVDRVTGPVLDFCLLVTRRRHHEDVDLQVEGSTARAWVPIAQAFAGPPGPGRAPGQFGI